MLDEHAAGFARAPLPGGTPLEAHSIGVAVEEPLFLDEPFDYARPPSVADQFSPFDLFADESEAVAAGLPAPPVSMHASGATRISIHLLAVALMIAAATLVTVRSCQVSTMMASSGQSSSGR